MSEVAVGIAVCIIRWKYLATPHIFGVALGIMEARGDVRDCVRVEGNKVKGILLKAGRE